MVKTCHFLSIDEFLKCKTRGISKLIRHFRLQVITQISVCKERSKKRKAGRNLLAPPVTESHVKQYAMKESNTGYYPYSEAIYKSTKTINSQIYKTIQQTRCFSNYNFFSVVITTFIVPLKNTFRWQIFKISKQHCFLRKR